MLILFVLCRCRVRQTLTKYYSHEQPYPVQEAAVLSLHHLTAASLSSASNAVHLIQQPFAPSMRYLRYPILELKRYCQQFKISFKRE